jgi:hypothetical protein
LPFVEGSHPFLCICLHDRFWKFPSRMTLTSAIVTMDNTKLSSVTTRGTLRSLDVISVAIPDTLGGGVGCPSVNRVRQCPPSFSDTLLRGPEFCRLRGCQALKFTWSGCTSALGETSSSGTSHFNDPAVVWICTVCCCCNRSTVVRGRFISASFKSLMG